MMELFGLVEDQYSSIAGVSMVPGTFNTFPCFHLHSNALLAQPTKYINLIYFLKLYMVLLPFSSFLADSVRVLTDERCLSK